MKTKSVAMVLVLILAFPAFAQKKEDERLGDSAKVMTEILSAENGLPKSILAKGQCVLIFPKVKKVAIGIGGSYGRGELVCRKGSQMNGSWGSPVMYKLDQGSLGIQLGSTETDFVLVVMNQKGVEQILNGKVKLGGNAAAAAGPTGAEATSYDANAMNVDILTYSRSEGLFAGVSLEGATTDEDKDANKALYGKDHTPKQIIAGQPSPTAGRALTEVLDKASPTRT